MNSDVTTNKFVAVLNKKIETGRLMNALGHMAAGLCASYSSIADMQFGDYFDKDGGTHRSISDNPFIVLVADNSNQLRILRNNLIVRTIHFNDFTNTMSEGTYVEQRTRTQQTPEGELEYWGICMFGDKETVSELTKKFSLWK